ncbi:MAG: hypothetical protein AAF958_16215 [Planctomycetota bacterium]
MGFKDPSPRFEYRFWPAAAASSLRAVAMQKPHRGFVLLLVIAVLTVVLTAMVTLANTSLRRAEAASDATRRLQVRWGHRSLRKTLMAAAKPTFQTRFEQWTETRLAAGNRRPPEPPTPWIDGTVQLGRVAFDVRLGDDQAKLPINAIYHQEGIDSLAAAMRRSSDGWGRAIRLVPATPPLEQNRRGLQNRLGLSELRDRSDDEDDDDDSRAEETVPATPPAFRSWGEVVDAAVIAQAGPNAWAESTRWWNLGASRTLNIKRASEPVIIATAESILGPAGARRFAWRHRQNRSASIEALLQSEVSVQRNRQRLADRLSATSESFSLWVRSRSPQATATFKPIESNRPGGFPAARVGAGWAPEIRFYSWQTPDEGPPYWFSQAF